MMSGIYPGFKVKYKWNSHSCTRIMDCDTDFLVTTTADEQLIDRDAVSDEGKSGQRVTFRERKGESEIDKDNESETHSILPTPFDIAVAVILS